MKVKSLIHRLKMLDPEKEIFISSDEEGNKIYRQGEICLFDFEYKNNYCIFPDGGSEIL